MKKIFLVTQIIIHCTHNSIGGWERIEVLTARAKRLIILPKCASSECTKKNLEDSEEESDSHSIFYRAITDVETRWSSTYIAWERLMMVFFKILYQLEAQKFG